MSHPETAHLFDFFNEIGILEQLSRALLEARLPRGLIAPHFTVLNHLVRLGNGKVPIDMARAFQVPKTSLTQTLKGLEQRGLIEMRPNAADGRSKLVWITAKGRSLRDKVIEDLGPDFESLSENIDMGQIAALMPILRDVRIFMDHDRNGPMKPPRAAR